MPEFLTEALVLKKDNFGESDGLVYFYTEKLGKAVVKAKGLKKILSKSNSHLEPLNFVDVRLVSGRNGYFQLIDVLPSERQFFSYAIKKSPDDLAKFLRLADFINDFTFEFQPDFSLWQALKTAVERNEPENKINRQMLKILGFDPQFAMCHFCGRSGAAFFSKAEHIFACRKCVSQLNKSEVLLI